MICGMSEAVQPGQEGELSSVGASGRVGGSARARN